MDKEYLSSINYIRLCNKIFIPNEPIHYEHGDTVFLLSHFISFFKVPSCNIRLVSVGIDQNLECFCTREQYENIINNDNVLEWIVDYTCLPSHKKLKKYMLGLWTSNYDYLVKNADKLSQLPKIDDIFYINTVQTNVHDRMFLPRNEHMKNNTNFIEEMAKYKYVFCSPGTGLTTNKVCEAICCGSIPIIQCSSEFREFFDVMNIQYISIPGIHTGYHITCCNPIKRKGVYCHVNKNVRNRLELIEFSMTTDFQMSREDAINTIGKLQNFVDAFQTQLVVAPWNKEIVNY